MFRSLRSVSVLVAVCAVAPLAMAQSYTIQLTIDDPPVAAGDYSIVAGNAVAVTFLVDDTDAELHAGDDLQLFAIATGDILAEVTRGAGTSGTVYLATFQEFIAQEVAARYVHDGVSLADTAVTPVTIVTDAMTGAGDS